MFRFIELKFNIHKRGTETVCLELFLRLHCIFITAIALESASKTAAHKARLHSCLVQQTQELLEREKPLCLTQHQTRVIYIRATTIIVSRLQGSCSEALKLNKSMRVQST